MPQKRMRIMHNDALHAPLAIGSGMAIYGWTLQEFVLALWAAYVVILIAIKLPELAQKYRRVCRFLRKLWGKR